MSWRNSSILFGLGVNAQKGVGGDSNFKDLGDQDNDGVICNNADFQKS